MSAEARLRMSNRSVDYRVEADGNTHREWDQSLDPAVTVEPGSVVEFDCKPGGGDAITPGMGAQEATGKPFPGHCLTGPVAVEGIQPGEILHVELLDVTAADWGYTYIRAGAGTGLLPDLIEDPFIHHWNIEDGMAQFVDGIEVPVQPFPGTIGLAPDGGPQSTIPPRRVGGNMDIKYLTSGSELWLPADAEGGLLSIGDGHATQGDGEVCLTAIETPINATVRLTPEAERSMDTPQYRTERSAATEGPVYATTGIADSLWDAAESAVAQLIEYLGERRDLSPGEAYALCSVAADLRINEVVNEPNYVVSAQLPETIL
jgi:acetamidase/formamidase